MFTSAIMMLTLLYIKSLQFMGLSHSQRGRSLDVFVGGVGGGRVNNPNPQL